MKALNIRFSETEHQQLLIAKEKQERSINDIVREAVRQYLIQQDMARLI